MKKFTILIIIICIIFTCGCTKESEIKIERPADTNLELWIKQDVKDFNFGGFTNQIYDVNIKIYYGSKYTIEKNSEGQCIDPEYCVKYSITAYPDYADGGLFVTEIIITDPEVILFGLTVNSTFEEFDSVFEGFQCEMYKTDEYHKAEKDGVTYRLKKGRFTISAEVTNKNGITV